MKKRFFSFFILLISLYAYSKTPDVLKGIWKGYDRYIFLGDEEQIAIILKEYYGWYYDRVCEPESFSSISKRKRNLATKKNACEIKAKYTEIQGIQNLWELTLQIDKKTSFSIPIVVYDNKIYLNFLIKIPNEQNELNGSLADNDSINTDGIYGYWQGLNSSDSIRFSGRENKKDIISWYITQNGVYRLRFWETNMIHEDSKAAFSDENKLYTVNKHILSCGQNYTCVSGRSSNIRNVEKYPKIPFDYKMTEDGNIILLDDPYLTKAEDKSSAEELLQIVEQANSRKKPDPPALFPPEELDWHWDLINRLEQGNKIIEELRKRQKEFGPRAQDIERKK